MKDAILQRDLCQSNTPKNLLQDESPVQFATKYFVAFERYVKRVFNRSNSFSLLHSTISYLKCLGIQHLNIKEIIMNC